MLSVPAAFYDFFRSVYGERWDSLFGALQKGTSYCARVNTYLSEDQFRALIKRNSDWQRLEFDSDSYINSDNHFDNPDSKGYSGLMPYYLLDPASVICASLLNFRENERVLDICAAPGGKAIILSQQLAESGSITINELSRIRFFRLKNNILSFVPAEKINQVRFLNKDGAALSRYLKGEQFDAVLADVPCSSERHLIHGKGNISEWKSSRSKKLAYKQFAILASAFDLLKPGGRLIYSTCSISPFENDAVVAKILKKRDNAFIVIPELKIGEQMDFGRMIMPDSCNGWGPIYLSQIMKKF